MTWFEIACAEPRKAWAFYRGMFGWNIDESSETRTFTKDPQGVAFGLSMHQH